MSVPISDNGESQSATLNGDPQVVAHTSRPSGGSLPMVRSVAIGSDHRGVKVKQQIIDYLQARGIAVEDHGAATEEACDYPDFARPVAIAVAQHLVDRGILICGTGMGMNIAANKYRGIRAVQIHDDVTAEVSRRHNDANVMCLSADLIGDRLLTRMVDVWLETEFEGGRHQRRLDKVRDVEEQPADESLDLATEA